MGLLPFVFMQDCIIFVMHNKEEYVHKNTVLDCKTGEYPFSCLFSDINLFILWK